MYLILLKYRPINEHSLQVLPAVYVEPALADAEPGRQFQFLRMGYFTVDKATEIKWPLFWTFNPY
ncbi:MAG: hypothetical protein K8F30_14375 [Taibaiella sp.]|nr:hypothetical protein [Taibaiella sp.]